MEKKVVPDKLINDVCAELMKQLLDRINQKGDHPYNSEYEMLGVLQLEFDEVKEGIQNRRSQTHKENELFDTAVTAIWGVCSYRAGMKQRKKKKK